jgi:hypothetical protein
MMASKSFDNKKNKKQCDVMKSSLNFGIDWSDSYPCTSLWEDLYNLVQILSEISLEDEK